jgi:hypothetical protein
MLRRISSAVSFLIALPILIIFDASNWVRDTISIWRGRHRRILRSVPGKPQPPRDPKRFAIVLWFPDGEGLFSLTNLLNVLRLEQISVLLIANRAPSQQALNQISGLYDHFILRGGEGRDFGGFQCGIEWLHRSGVYAGLDALILANDSLFYSQTGLLRDLRELLAGEEPWSCLYESYRPVLHAQSFFLVFRRPLIHSTAFTQFWEEYSPRSARRHAVTKGEIGLSRALTKGGFLPFAVYSSSRVGLDVYETLSQQWANAELQEVLNLSIPDTLPKMLPREETPQQIASLVSRRMEITNPTHGGGLLCNWLYEAPLKRDLHFRGTHAVSHIVRFARGFDKLELQSIERDLKRRATAQVSYVDKVLCKYGRK